MTTARKDTMLLQQKLLQVKSFPCVAPIFEELQNENLHNIINAACYICIVDLHRNLQMRLTITIKNVPKIMNKDSNILYVLRNQWMKISCLNIRNMILRLVIN